MAATIALFGVLAGGGAYAASQIGHKDIKRNAVRAKHIKKKQVKGKHIKRSAVGTKHLTDGAVADTLDGLGSEEFIRGTGQAFLGKGSANLSGVFDPNRATTQLGTIPGLGSFAVGGAFSSSGNDSRVTFTNLSGGPVAVNGNANPGLSDNGTIELAGAEVRPQGADATFTVVTPGAGKAVSGAVTVTFGFPGVVCAGTVHGLVSG